MRKVSLLTTALLWLLGGCARGYVTEDGSPAPDAGEGDSGEPPRDTGDPSRPDRVFVGEDTPEPEDTPAPRDSGGPDALVGTGRAGGPCADDAACGGMLVCDRMSTADGFCTAACTNGTAVSEQAQCGGLGSTCLANGDPPDQTSLCTRGCDPNAASTGCRPGQVCTGLWLTHAMGQPDAPGCLPFCASNAQCASGSVCNVRTGGCGPSGSDPTRRADGLPCVPPPMGSASPCRGLCFQVDSDPTHGICGSFINTNVTTSCPDGAGNVPLVPTGDNLALCLYRRCSTNAECAAPLSCQPTMSGNFCMYP